MNKFITLSLLVFATAFFSSCGSPTSRTNKPSQESLESIFSGYWKVADTEGNVFYISLQPDGDAVSTWGQGETGTWKIVGERAEIKWNDGWYEFIYSEGGKFRKIAFAPGTPLYHKATNVTDAIKVEKIPPAALPKTQK